jgi:YD repeat-containing protein
VRKVDVDGVITTAVGGGDRQAETRPAVTDVWLEAPDGLAFGADGTLFVGSDGQLIRVSPELPGLSVDDIVLPSEGGEILYVFSGRGRHLSTRDAFTGVALLTFDYDDAGQLVAVTDVDGLKTQIERNSKGIPTTTAGSSPRPTRWAAR